MLLWQIVKRPHENKQEQMWATIGIYCKCELKWEVELVLDKVDLGMQIQSHANCFEPFAFNDL